MGWSFLEFVGPGRFAVVGILVDGIADGGSPAFGAEGIDVFVLCGRRVRAHAEVRDPRVAVVVEHDVHVRRAARVQCRAHARSDTDAMRGHSTKELADRILDES